MDRNTITGFILIGAILIAWSYFNKPDEVQLAKEKARVDSLRLVEKRADSLAQLPPTNPSAKDSTTAVSALSDSAALLQAKGRFGAFVNASLGEENIITLQNDLMKVSISTKGGTIKMVELKKHFKPAKDLRKKDEKTLVQLLEDPRNQLEYLIPLANVSAGAVSTKDLFFVPQKSADGKSLTLRADAGNGRYFEQTYALADGVYLVDYNVKMVGLDQVVPINQQNIQLNWVNYVDKIERNVKYERMYTSVFFRSMEKGVDNLKLSGNDTETTEEKVQWVSNVQQFFNTSLISAQGFKGATFSVEDLDEASSDLKKHTTLLNIPFERKSEQLVDMQMFLGPNEFDDLRALKIDLEEVIQFGWGIFAAINRWMIRPIFIFMLDIVGSAGVGIILLTVIVKLLVYPLTYGMLRSQSKVKALRPQLEKIKAKIGDDPQQLQAEQMKLYRETGVNPLGGCFPMLLQMPIWFALYRFFPASIEFRQKSFWWADDLSSYDSIFSFGEIPVISAIYGDHVSLFTLLWVITTLIYTYFNMQNIDMGMQQSNPSMKYIQYIMPITFLFFFNNYAAGLSCYLLFSNVLNITQTLVTQNYLINHKKIEAELEANKKKPKKTTGFQARLEAAMQQQQEVARKQQTEQAKRNNPNNNANNKKR